MRRSRHGNAGFSLVELIVVLLLLAILSLAVTVSFSAAVRSARGSAMESRLAEFDRRSREHAIRFGRPVSLWIDTARGTAGHDRPDNDTDTVWPIAEADGDQIEQVWIAGESPRSGRVSIACSANGYSPSYAVRLRSAHGEPRWVLVAGLTGEMARGLSENAVQQSINLARAPATPTSPNRVDAD